MISIQSATKKYSSEVTIGPLDLNIPEGGMTSLIGLNGAGKSTLLLMMGRLLPMDRGTITIGGKDITHTPSPELAKTVAILRQENHFVTRLTVRQLVGFGRFPHTHGRLNEEDEVIISRYIDFLGLQPLEHRYLDELSGGQRQRAYVAMVLSQETDYVLLDEPLNNLDVSRSVQMMKHLHSACRRFHRTIITVMHDINFAAQYSDSICAMKNGQIVAFGSPEEIMRSDLLSHLFDTPIEMISTDRGPFAMY